MVLGYVIPPNTNPVIGLNHSQAIFVKRLQGRTATIDVVKNSDVPRHGAVPVAAQMSTFNF